MWNKTADPARTTPRDTTFQTTKLQHRAAFTTSLLSVTVTLLTLPFARQMAMESHAFLPAYIAMAVVFELMTSYLLVRQYRVNRSPGQLVLAGTYLFTGLIAIPHLLTFPDGITSGFVLGAGPETAVWLWVFWKGGFALGVITYVLIEWPKSYRAISRLQKRKRAQLVLLSVALLVVLLTVTTTAGQRFLPMIIEGSDYHKLVTSGVGPALIGLNVGALVGLLLLKSRRTVTRLWLSVATLATILELTVILFAGHRFSIGWYMARVNSLLSSGVMLIAFIYELNRLYDALTISEQRYASLFKNNVDVVFSVDLNGNFRDANLAVERVLGYPIDKLFDRTFRTFIKSEDSQRAYEHVQMALKGEPQNYELDVVHKNGYTVSLHMTNVPIIVDSQIVGVYGIGKDITERKRAEAMINHMAYHDALTGLPNRRLFKDRLMEALTTAQKKKHMMAVMFLDLDRFKVINDTLGHDTGDLLLKAVTQRLVSCVDPGMTVSRMGGDEFTVLMPEIEQEACTINVAQRILHALQQPMILEGQELHITTSIGIALFPADGENAETLMRHADSAMYRAKEKGKNNYQLYKSVMNAHSFNRLALENDLRKALERGEFVVYYQPQVNILTGEIIGMEALVRWQSPVRGLVSPGQFIPLAEETGLIVPLGEWVLRTACEQNKKWQDAGFPPLRVGVNLSTHQFSQPHIVETVAQVLQETQLPPELLELEITESSAMHHVDRVILKLQELNKLGLKISIDDFGTGYSSLNYLKHFPIHRLKIDQIFVRDLDVDSEDATIVSTIIAMARSLHLDVIAEGVETVDQVDFLRDKQCYEMQGYHFSKPLPPEQFEQLLMAGTFQTS